MIFGTSLSYLGPKNVEFQSCKSLNLTEKKLGFTGKWFCWSPRFHINSQNCKEMEVSDVFEGRPSF